MPEPTKIPRPFADSGDKNSIPDSSGSIGFASWQEGFPAITSEPFAQGGVAPKRADFNGIFNALSAATVWQQKGGLWAYDNATDYEVGNVVIYNGGLYKCITANGPSSSVKSPTDATVWEAIISASGGTFTGNLLFSQSSARLLKKDNSGDLRLFGGTSYSNGGNFSLIGKDAGGNAGCFLVNANDGINDTTLVGYPNGSLTWGGKVLNDNGTFNALFFSQTSGSYTAPYTGVYRVTLKGGGGGGGGQGTNKYSSGGGGGEGGTLVFYTTLTKNQSYNIVVGAGGAAGADTADGSAGGSSSFNGFIAGGGVGGNSGDYVYRSGGLGGRTFTIPAGEAALKIPGANGVSGILCAGNSDLYVAVGGGSGGGRTGSTSTAAVYGGGGGGGIYDRGATAGGDGYILIEYAG